jgi:two-component system LytT family sensor kinase
MQSHEMIILIIATLVVTGLWLGQKIYVKLLRRQSVLLGEIEIEKAINYFTASLIDHNTIGEVLWDVTRNCIGRLNFEDCVIYTMDEKSQVLVQKAAYGPKNPRNFEILHPIEIPAGKGIVGSVAVSGKAEIIYDTTQDPRYIRDDAMRLAEITVPIIADGKVIGVIDAEHSQKGFFKQHHLRILTTIASLCATKIAGIQAQETVRAVELQVARLNRELAEAKVLAIRQQMNPHFLFNTLTSINNTILQGNTDLASKLLTQFSRLIRLVLDNARSEWVSLDQELKALQLYIQLESTRFDGRFTLDTLLAPELNGLAIQVPPMLFQPLAEKIIRQHLLDSNAATVNLLVQCWQQHNRLYVQMGSEMGTAGADPGNVVDKQRHEVPVEAERLRAINELYKADAALSLLQPVDEEGKPMAVQYLFTMKLKRS